MRALRFFLLTILALVALIVVGLATPPGRAIVAGMIERAASSDGMTMSVGSLSGWPPFWLGADTIVLSDADGPFAEIDNLDVDVKVLALLTGTIALDSIAAERVTILRTPKLPGGGGDGALLPFAADRVSVARLELGSELAGRPAALALEGSASVTAAGSIAARLVAERIDGRAGTLALSIDRASADAPLAVEIDIRESADGILVGLMGRPSGPGYALVATSAVDGDALGGDISLTSDGAARFDGRFSLAPAGDGRRLVLDGAGDLAELVPPDYADLLGGSIDVAVDATWETAAGEALPRLTIREGVVSTGSVHATASGSFAAALANLNLTLDAANPDGNPIVLPLAGTPSRIDSISLSGRVAPSGDAVRLDLVGRVAGLEAGETRVPGLGLSLAVETASADPLAGGNLPFALRVEADAIQAPTGRIDSVSGRPLVLTADGTFDTATAVAETTARLSAAGGTADFAGTVAANGARGRLSADFADLRLLSPLAGRGLAGALDAVAEGTFAGDEIAFTLNGSALDVDPGEATLARLLGGVTGFAANVSRRADGSFSVADVRIDGISFDAAGEVALSADSIDASIEGALADLALLADQSSGAATFTARVTGAPGQPDVDATLTVAEGRLSGQRVENAVVGFKGAPRDGGWEGALTLAGSVAGGPLAGTANVAVDAARGLVAFPDVDLAVGDNRIAGAIERTAAGPLSGTLTVDAPRLETLAALALLDATGNGRAEVRFQPDGERQSISVSFVGRDLSYATIAADAVQGDVGIEDAFGAPQVNGNAAATAISVGTLRLDTAEATAIVEGGATRFRANARGPDLDLSGGGSLGGAAGQQTVRIDTLTGTAFRFPIQLNQPVTISLDGAQSRVAGATLALGGGTVRVDGAVQPQLDLTVVADNVAASVANSFAPDLGAEGAVSGRATVTGDPASPAIAWTATWSNLRTAATREVGLPGLSLTARGNATRAATDIVANLTGAGLALAISGNAPFGGPGLNIRAEGDAPLAALASLSDRELRLAGVARVNLTVTGSTAAPAIAGTVDIADATFADADSGFIVTGANGRIDFDGRRATIRQLSGRMGQGGEVTAAGSVEIAEAGLPASLTVRVANGRYSDGTTVNTTFSADLGINGPLANARVSGQIDLGRTEIQLPDRVGAAGAIEVRHVNAPAGFSPPQPRLRPGASRSATAASSGGGLGLDIQLTGNSGVFVRGFGIDAELGGGLRLAGTTGNPQAIGALQMRWGRIETLGKRFDFTRGQVTFSGDLTPYVDFAATTRTADATVTLNVVGPADDPQIRFTSSPDMPEEEIISRLLFERSVGTLSPLQAVQLVDAVAQLTGAVGSGGILARIRQATGLDDIDIRQSATGGTTVGVGRRINENLRLGVEAGTGSASGRIVIDLDLTERLKARGEAGQDGSGSVGLTYEREY